LALRDHAFEVEVLDGMVLDVDRLAAHARIERGPLRYRPAGQHTVDLQAEVVVQASSPMALDDEAPARTVTSLRWRPGGLGRGGVGPTEAERDDRRIGLEGEVGDTVEDMFDDRPDLARPLGEHDERLAGVEDLLAGAERLTVGLATVDREPAEVVEEPRRPP